MEILPDGFAVDRSEPVRWDRIEKLSFALDRPRGIVMMTLRIRLAHGEEILSVNGGGPEVDNYVVMLRSLVEAIEVSRPELEVTLGHIGGARIGMFVVGVFGCLVGIGLVVGGVYLVTDRGRWGELGMSFVGLIFGFFSFLLASANRPWRKPPSHPLPVFRKQLETGNGR